MFGLEGILASVLLPAGIDLAKSTIGAIVKRFVGVSVDDEIKLEQAMVEKLKALAELDNPHGTPSQWVIDLRASFRYIAAAILIAAGVTTIGWAAWTANAEAMTIGFNLAGMPWAFVFGERLWAGLKGNLSK